jgi:hypothetical protein
VVSPGHIPQNSFKIKGVNPPSEIFSKKILKCRKTLKIRFKNSAEKFENRDTLDFTFIEMIFIIIQVLVMMVVIIGYTLKIFLDTP